MFHDCTASNAGPAKTAHNLASLRFRKQAKRVIRNKRIGVHGGLSVRTMLAEKYAEFFYKVPRRFVQLGATINFSWGSPGWVANRIK